MVNAAEASYTRGHVPPPSRAHPTAAAAAAGNGVGVRGGGGGPFPFSQLHTSLICIFYKKKKKSSCVLFIFDLLTRAAQNPMSFGPY